MPSLDDILGPPPPVAPAIKKDGRVVPGTLGQTHDDILGPATPDKARGFVTAKGQFEARETAGKGAQAAGLDVPTRLHSEELNGAKLSVDSVLGAAPDAKPSRGRQLLDAATAPIRDFAPTYDKKWRENLEQAKTGVKRIGKGEILGGAKDAALGTLGYIASPIDAAVESIVSKPVEKATGTPKDVTTAAVEMLGPGLVARIGKVPGLIYDVTKGTTIEKMLSPTTVDKSSQAAEGTIRSAIGRGERDTARTEAALTQHAPMIAKLPEAARLNLIDYMENRSKGATIPSPALQKVADDIREANQLRAAKYRTLPSTQQAGFIEDYFVHEWENPQKAAQFASDFVGKQGSGRNLKARELPTVADGLRAGLKLKTTDPVEATIRYAANMDRFLATNEIVDTMRGSGQAKYFKPGTAPDGWMEMKGRLSQKITPVGPMKLYAPEGAATVFNNFVSRGFADIGPNAAKAYDTVQRAANTITSLKLGLSAFHATTMANEAVINDVARAVGQAGRGDLLRAAKTAGLAITAPVKTYQRGRELLKEYLATPTSTNRPTPLSKIAQLGSEANMRIIKRDPTMMASDKGSYWKSYQRGTLGKEMKTAGAQVMTAKGFAPEVIKQAGRLMDTIAAPLFDKYIPTLKAGAFYDNMAEWLRANPSAAAAEEQKAARAIWDSIDNRFGELVQDNLFWNKIGKQIAQVVTLSPGWGIGTIREIGGGVKDIATGKGLTERAKYVVALPIVTGLTGSILQYFKTGQTPDERTLLGLYKTGGKNPDGSDERGMVPGYMKDVIGYAHDPGQEIANKANPALSLGVDLATNKDWRGLPIANPTDSAKPGERTKERLGYAAEQIEPIAVGSLMHQKAGSNISPMERILGVRPAPAYEQNPEKVEKIEKGLATRAWTKKLRADALAKKREKP
jgi:hypothetical protein